MPNVLKQYTKFIFPFQFEKEGVDPKGAQLENSKGVKQSIFEPFSVHTESLREGLDLMLSAEGGKSKIADCYALNINCRKHFLLPPKKTEVLSFVNRQSEGASFDVAISEIKVYLFESHIGFVEVECEYSSRTIESYLELNYFICEAKSDKNLFVYHKKNWDPATKTTSVESISFSMKDLLEKVLSSISKSPDGIHFVYHKVKPVIYSHLIVDEKPDNMGELLQHLAKNYKSSYKFDDSCSKVKTFHPFENSYWTTSLNGAVNISFLTDDENTNDFFVNNFYHKTRNTYFFLFLNVVHQRYAIMRIIGKMGNLDRLANDYYVMAEELTLARQYETDAINLKFRAFFKLPSNIDHINVYYDTIYESFQVGTLYDHFDGEIKNLQNICGKYVDRIKERDEKIRKRKNAKIEIFVSIFSALVAEVTLFNNSWSLIEKVLGHSVSFWSPAILILFGTLISPMFTIIFNVSKKVTEIKQLTKQIDSDKSDYLLEDDKTRKKKGRMIAKLRKKHK